MADWTLTRIPLAVLASGAEVALVIHELVGRRGTGPTLGISAAIHGDEAVGVEILYHLRERLEPGALRGRVLLLPCANPLAYQANTRNTPLDMTNLNRVFPGDPAGWFTEHLAELRVRLRNATVALLVCTGAAYFFAEELFVWLAGPMVRAWAENGLGTPTLHFLSPIEPFWVYLKVALICGLFAG